MEDYYCYYVEILGISEELFWYGDVSFVVSTAENMAAYRNWENYVVEKEREKNRK